MTAQVLYGLMAETSKARWALGSRRQIMVVIFHADTLPPRWRRIKTRFLVKGPFQIGTRLIPFSPAEFNKMNTLQGQDHSSPEVSLLPLGHNPLLQIFINSTRHHHGPLSRVTCGPYSGDKISLGVSLRRWR